MHPVTYKGLHKWTVKSFEKLGWMLLMLKYGDNPLKINAYLMSLENLKQAIIDKRNVLSEADRKLDLDILLDQVSFLSDFANTNLKVATSVSAFGSRR
jgi:hypothetical protein